LIIVSNIVPKLINVAAGCLVLGLLLHRWLPSAIRERRKSERDADDLKTFANTDGLTGYRRHFDAIGASEWAHFQRYRRPFSVLLMNVDCFKLINNRFGHDIGDTFLRSSMGSDSSLDGVSHVSHWRVSHATVRQSRPASTVSFPSKDLHSLAFRLAPRISRGGSRVAWDATGATVVACRVARACTTAGTVICNGPVTRNAGHDM
jgi:hypothetical protein